MACRCSCKRRRRARVAEVDEGNEEEEALGVPTIMGPMEEKRRKTMSRKIMR